MLDRRTIKGDVKGILGGSGKGSVFLATLLVFIIVLVYFGAVWGVAQFYPIAKTDLMAISDFANTTVNTSQAEIEGMGRDAYLSKLSDALRAFENTFKRAGMIQTLAFVLELIIILPLTIGVQKFMLRVIRLKYPGAGTVFKGYTGPYFFRSILLPFWTGLCMIGWQIIFNVLLGGIIAGIALGTGLNTQDFAALTSSATAETVNSIITTDYISKYGWMYIVAVSGWSVINCLFMIFKQISYSLSGMALAERPQMGVRKAVRASRRITRKNHFSLFVVSLSFIGWYLLVGVALALVVAVGVGLNMLNMGQLGLIITLALLLIVTLLCMYLLMPYRVGVHAQCYVQLKRSALENGTVIREDFRGKRELNSAEEQN